MRVLGLLLATTAVTAAALATLTLAPAPTSMSGAAAATSAGPAALTVVGAVPGPSVDVYVDGVCLAVVGYGALTPLRLTPGRHAFAAVPAGHDVTGAAVSSVTVGGDVTAVAQPGPGGDPTVALYPDDFTPVPDGRVRLTVRHAADAGPVDVTVTPGAAIPAAPTVAGQTPQQQILQQQVLAGAAPPPMSRLTPGSQATLTVPAGTWSLTATSTGAAAGAAPEVTGAGPQGLELVGGRSYVVYLTGNPGTGYGYVVDVLTGLVAGLAAGQPTVVPAGDGSAGWRGPSALPALALLVVGLAAAAAVGGLVHAGARPR